MRVYQIAFPSEVWEFERIETLSSPSKLVSTFKDLYFLAEMLQNVLCEQETQLYLIDEGGKAVVQRLDLLLLLSAHHLDIGVDLQVEGRQQALVDRDASDGRPQIGRAGAKARGRCSKGDPTQTAVAVASHLPTAPHRAAGTDALASQTHSWTRETV